MLSNFTVVIPAYQRMDMLSKRIKEIAPWSNLARIIISIDGLRKTADFQETARRDEVIEFSEIAASENSQIVFKVWPENLGINSHVYRIFETFGSDVPELIVIEEDVSIGMPGLQFLANGISEKEVMATSAYVARNHYSMEKEIFRRSLFPSQWGIAIKKQIMMDYLNVINTRKIDRSLIRDAFYRDFKNALSVLELERLTQWWYNHFFFCILHGNWADAIIQYCVLASGSHYRIPAQSLVTDMSPPGDKRALTPRDTTANVLSCLEGKRIPGTYEFECLKCELSNSHLPEADFRTLLGASKHHFKLKVLRRSSL